MADPITHLIPRALCDICVAPNYDEHGNMTVTISDSPMAGGPGRTLVNLVVSPDEARALAMILKFSSKCESETSIVQERISYEPGETGRVND